MPGSPETSLAAIRAELSAFVRRAQGELCAALEQADGAGRFGADAWERPGGGGGLTRDLSDGALLEKAGVSVSEVFGTLDAASARRLDAAAGPGRSAPPAGGAPETFFAAGLSLVLHPRSPFVPTAHLNVRFLQRGARAWFGGGADLTPHYLFDEDCAHFHRALRDPCERLAPGAYARMKRACDAYFFLRHRGEHRGVGGIFFEDLGGDPARELAFVQDLVAAFPRAYLPIGERRRALPWGERERRWQEIRRGRYAEFNLVLDRGTLFGLETSGRIESVLMSLPPTVRWVYDHRPEPGSPEARLLEVLRAPRDWA